VCRDWCSYNIGVTGGKMDLGKESYGQKDLRNAERRHYVVGRVGEFVQLQSCCVSDWKRE
jgi:hypothetical protein